MWLRDASSTAIVAMNYGPSSLNAEIAGKRVSLKQETMYPFENDISVKFSLESPMKFPFRFRVPSWADIARSDSWHDLLDARMNNTLTRIQAQYYTFPRPAIELYDLESDPNEQDNLAYKREYQDIISALLDKLREWQKETSDRESWEHEKSDAVDRLTGMPLMPFKRMK